MTISISDILNKVFKKKDNSFLDDYSSELLLNNSYQALAMKASINLIAKTVSRAEFKTFEQGKETKKRTYYMLNVEANKNKSANQFWRETIEKLLLDGEALILIEDDELLLIDSFEKQEFAFKENIYRNMVVGDYELRDIRNESQVIYLKDDLTSIHSHLNAISNDMASLIASSIKGYQGSKSRKGAFKMPTNMGRTKEQQEATQKHINNIMESFMDPSVDSVLPETNGMEYREISEAKGSKSNDSGRETKNFIDDIFDLVAITFGIPPSLLKGDTVDTKDAVNNFLAFCINPLVQLIQSELNRKLFTFEQYVERTFLKVDTTNIKSVDLKDIANSIDLLVRNGAFTIDDTLRSLGQEAIGGDVGGLRVMTKNNEPIDQFMKGGD